MKKVFVLPPNEDWIVDRFVKEFRADNSDINVTDPRQADVIWLLADWCWRNPVLNFQDDQIPLEYFIRQERANKKELRVITTIHHVVPSKFGGRERIDFERRDQVTDVYHVPNYLTEAFIRPLTKKPIHVIPYWANQKIWRPTGTSIDLRKKHRLPLSPGEPNGVYLIGSFQRDTEGSDLISPKLEKGPDLLADAIITYRDRCKHLFPLQVVLAGWRRQYLMKRLDDAGVDYHYFELPPQELLNDLYQCLNLYPITARQEGGPQSLIECGLLGIPVVSRSVGIAGLVLPQTAINDNVTLATPAVPNVEHLKLPTGYVPFRHLIETA